MSALFLKQFKYQVFITCLLLSLAGIYALYEHSRFKYVKLNAKQGHLIDTRTGQIWLISDGVKIEVTSIREKQVSRGDTEKLRQEIKLQLKNYYQSILINRFQPYTPDERHHMLLAFLRERLVLPEFSLAAAFHYMADKNSDRLDNMDYFTLKELKAAFDTLSP